MSDQFPRGTVQELSEKLSELGCSDPYIVYVQAQLLQDSGAPDKAEPLMQKALDLLCASQYPPVFSYYAARRLLWLYASPQRGKAAPKVDKKRIEEIKTLKFSWLARAAADGVYTNGYQRYFMEEVDAEERYTKSLVEDGARVLAALRETPNVDRWILLMVEGRYHIHKGWQARGGEFAAKVPQEAWKVFGEELAMAQSCLMKAHRMHPEYPEAAAEMITVTMGTGDRAAQRTWFDRAVAAQFDFTPAYIKMLLALRPRWGGSHDHMYQWGLECLNTGRFDTEVPSTYMRAIEAIGMELGDPRAMYRNPRVYRDACRFFVGTLAEPAWKKEQDHWKTYQAMAAWAAGVYPDAARLLRELGDRADKDVFVLFGVNPVFVTGDIHLRSGPLAARLDAAEKLYAQDQSVKALPIYEELLAKSRDDAEAVALLTDRASVLRMKEKYLKGEWTDLAPAAGFAGWERVGGEWSVETNGTIKGVSTGKGDGLMLLAQWRMGGDYEIKGETEGPLEAGLVLGHFMELDWPRFVYFRIDPENKAVSIGQGYGRRACKTKKTELPNVNRFHIRVTSAGFTAQVNDKPVFNNEPINEEWWPPSVGQLGMGGNHFKCVGHTIRLRNLQIRRLAPPEETAPWH